MNILKQIAKKIWSNSQSGTDIRKLSIADQQLYLRCIEHYVINKREILEIEEPGLIEISNQKFISDIVDLIKDGYYEFIIGDDNNFLVFFKHQEENKLMHMVEGGQILV